MGVKEFLLDLKNNQHIMKMLGYTDNLLGSLIAEVDALQANQRTKDYAILRLKDKDYGDFVVENHRFRWKTPVGTVASYRKDRLVNRPYRIMVVDDEIWVCSLYQRIARFDADFSFKGYFGVWGDFTDEHPERYAYPRGFTVKEDRVYMAFEWRHRVACYDRNTGERVWVFGNGSPGVPENGQVYSPYDVDVLPNGHVLVACFYGQPEGAVSNAGMVIELDEDGKFVKTHLSYKKDGYPWNGDVSHPVSLRVVENPETGRTEVWISYWSGDLIAIFEWNESEGLVYKDIIGKTPGLNVGAVRIRDFFVDYPGKKVYISADGPKKIACLDLETHNLVGYIGKVLWEDYDGNPETPAGFSQVAGLALTDDGRILVCDYGNNRVQQFPINLLVASKVELEYEGTVPAFKHVEFVSNNDFNLKAMTISKYRATLLYECPDPEIVICGLL